MVSASVVTSNNAHRLQCFTVTSDRGKDPVLPEPTVASEFGASESEQLVEQIMTSVKLAFKECRVTGTIFASVGDRWAWRHASPQ